MGGSQSPDEDSLSSDATERSNTTAKRNNGLNPLTRIHCLPTLCRPAYAKSDPERPGLNPLTRIHCLPTPPPPFKFVRLALILSSQSPDEDSLSSDKDGVARLLQSPHGVSQSPDEDSLSSDNEGGKGSMRREEIDLVSIP